MSRTFMDARAARRTAEQWATRMRSELRERIFRAIRDAVKVGRFKCEYHPAALDDPREWVQEVVADLVADGYKVSEDDSGKLYITW